MKRKWILLAALVIPACLYLNIWQAFRYTNIQGEVEALEVSQQTWLERNKKVIVGIEVLGAPQRIDTLASEMEDLVQSEDPPVVRIHLSGEADG